MPDCIRVPMYGKAIGTRLGTLPIEIVCNFLEAVALKKRHLIGFEKKKGSLDSLL